MPGQGYSSTVQWANTCCYADDLILLAACQHLSFVSF